MLVRIDLTGVTPVPPCTLYLFQVIANVGASTFDYTDGQFNTTVSTVSGVWENGSSDFNPEEGSACWKYRAYSATTPVNWVVGDANSTLASVSKGQGGTHVNSTRITLNTAASALPSYVVLDDALVADLQAGCGGLLIYRATGQASEMKFSTNNVMFQWDPNSAVQGAARIRAQGIRVSIAPNPFRSVAAISCDNVAAFPDIRIYSLDGALVRTLTGTTQGGIWNGTDNRGMKSPAGIYLYRVDDGKNRVNGRMQLLK
jgi:hypothetical protein